MREHIGQHPISRDYFKEIISPGTEVAIFIDAPNLDSAIEIMGLKARKNLDVIKYSSHHK